MPYKQTSIIDEAEIQFLHLKELHRTKYNAATKRIQIKQ